jgi:hypothetical protein
MFLNLYESNTAYIEVVYNNKVLHINFPILPICFLLDLDIRSQFIENMDRSHHDKKLKYIVEESKFLFIFVNTRFTFNKVVGRIYIILAIFKHINLWKELLFICTWICNIFILLSFSTFPKFTDQSLPVPDGISKAEFIRLYLPSLFTVDDYNTHIETVYAFNVLGVIQLFIFLIVIVHHVFNNMLTRYKIIKSQLEDKKLNSIRNVFYLFRWIHRPIKRFNFSNIWIFMGLLNDFDTLYLIIAFTFTGLGLAIHPFFYIFNLTNIFYKNETFKILVTSLYISKETLSNILILYCLILYIIALINFISFWDQYQNNFFCYTNMYQCFFSTLSAPFKNDDEFFLVDKTSEADIFDRRFAFDTVFTIFMKNIYIILFPALMIDTFKYMSNKAKTKHYDKLNICSICNFDRKEIEQHTNYNEHIYVSHNLWNYVYFIIYILSKPQNELNTLQKYLLYQINNNRHNWIPSKSGGYDIAKLIK